MLAEINLLPKKEPRNYSIILINISLTVLVIVAGIYLYFSYEKYNNEVQNLEQQIQTIKENVAIEKSKIDFAEKNNSVQQLKDIIKLGETNAIKMVPVLQHAISLLPERGFFMNFNYMAEGYIQLSAQFDTKREAATYLNSLISSEWTEDVKLTSLITVENEFLKAEASVKSSENTELTDHEKDEANKNKTIITKEKSSQLDADTYIPRYLGIYDIKLNTTYIKAIKRKETEQSSSLKGDEVN